MIAVRGKGKINHLQADQDSLFLRIGGVAPSLNCKCSLTAAG